MDISYSTGARTGKSSGIMMRCSLLYFCAVLGSCQGNVSQNLHDRSAAPTVEASTEQATRFDSNTFPADTSLQPISYPVPSSAAVLNKSARILFTGTFHGDEVEVGIDSLLWFGLFPGDSSDFVLKRTGVVANRVIDGLLDDEASGEMTGWEISTATDDSPLMLVWQKDLSEGFVNGLLLPGTIYPGDSVHIEFLGIRYLISATGSTKEHTFGTTVSDYNLKLSRIENGSTISKTLVSHSAFDDTMTSILWSGDLDRDGYLDLLIDMSNHYNRTAPTLFLSKPADPKDVVVQVAERSSVGC